MGIHKLTRQQDLMLDIYLFIEAHTWQVQDTKRKGISWTELLIPFEIEGYRRSTSNYPNYKHTYKHFMTFRNECLFFVYDLFDMSFNVLATMWRR